MNREFQSMLAAIGGVPFRDMMRFAGKVEAILGHEEEIAQAPLAAAIVRAAEEIQHEDREAERAKLPAAAGRAAA